MCYAVIVFVDFFTRPLANFEVERRSLEGIIARDSHLDPSYPSLSALHHFILALHAANQFSYYVILLTCTTLFFCGIIGLIVISKRESTK